MTLSTPLRVLIAGLPWLLLAACDPAAGTQASSSARGETEAVYVSLPAAGSVAKVRVADGAAASTTVGMLPHNLVLSADGQRLYVVLVGSQAVAEMDVATGSLLRTFLTEPVPGTRADGSVIQGHIDQGAFSHTSCFGCHHGRQGSASPAIVGTRPFGIALSADGARLFVTNTRTGTLAVIDVASGGIEQLVPLEAVGEAHEPTALARLGDSLFVSILPKLPSFAPAVVRQLDATYFTRRSESQMGPNAGVVLADAAHATVYVSNFETNTITRLGSRGEMLNTLTVGDGPLGLRVAGDRTLLSANYYNNSLSVIDLETRAVKTLPLALGEKRYSNPTHIALDASGRLAYVVSSGTQGHLLVYDLAATAFTRAVAIGGLPFDIVAVPRSSNP